MARPRTCPPHRWYLPNVSADIVEAHCLECGARQWQMLNLSLAAADQANKLNKKRHYPLVHLSDRARLFLSRAPVVGFRDENEEVND
jgi:hypothetical protein